ncbi:hypothetical protein L202_06772 [Cryptococcus amylolentus CBS 6039]|uniref:Uncharacterized protein n=1 Tax=Cryptococcus amylolentus CBS 6039 TaxID=1295533 RepID=A0A1E3HDE3_9TREE|nr:hypothetical protein L202_06772 [Cryptococcus amylolentus CBS 6039]ODN74360.1 hypothetical protein L202_06772 [Cryptococcus amylolentus CBS 6039]
MCGLMNGDPSITSPWQRPRVTHILAPSHPIISGDVYIPLVSHILQSIPHPHASPLYLSNQRTDTISTPFLHPHRVCAHNHACRESLLDNAACCHLFHGTPLPIQHRPRLWTSRCRRWLTPVTCHQPSRTPHRTVKVDQWILGGGDRYGLSACISHQLVPIPITDPASRITPGATLPPTSFLPSSTAPELFLRDFPSTSPLNICSKACTPKSKIQTPPSSGRPSILV